MLWSPACVSCMSIAVTTNAWPKQLKRRVFLSLVFVFWSCGWIEPRASHVVGKSSTTEIYPSPRNIYFVHSSVAYSSQAADSIAMGLSIMLKETAHFMETRKQTDRQEGGSAKTELSKAHSCDLFFQLVPPPIVPCPLYIKVSRVGEGQAKQNKHTSWGVMVHTRRLLLFLRFFQ